MTKPPRSRPRILWLWCAGHQRYEIDVLERQIGSYEFEMRCLDHYSGDIPFRVTHEAKGVSTIDAKWSHRPDHSDAG